MSAEESGFLKVALAVATVPFVLDIVARWIADAVARSDSPSLLMTILRSQFGPVMKEGQTLQSYCRELSTFWFQVALVLGLTLVAVYLIATWRDPELAEDVVFGTFVYFMGPLLVATAILRSVINLMRS